MKSEQLLYPVGIDDLFIVMYEQPGTVTEFPVFSEKIWRLPNVVKLGIKGNGSTSEKYASNKMFTRVSRETKHELSLDHVSFPVELWDEMNGLTSTEGVTFTKTEVKEMPFFALGAIGPLSNGESSAFWYPRVQLSNTTEHEYETTEEEIEVKDISCAMNATGLLTNNVLKADFNSARDSVKKFTVESFMQQVIYDEGQLEEILAGGTSSNG